MPQVAQGSGTTVLLFENLHRFMGSVELIQAVARQAITGKHSRAFIVVLVPAAPVRLGSMARSFRPRRTSCPWLRLRATRAMLSVSGLRADTCRRTERARTRARKEVEGGCGVSCGR
jgi:hypothetical protein